MIQRTKYLEEISKEFVEQQLYTRTQLEGMLLN